METGGKVAGNVLIKVNHLPLINMSDKIPSSWPVGIQSVILLLDFPNLASILVSDVSQTSTFTTNPIRMPLHNRAIPSCLPNPRPFHTGSAPVAQ
jgi:hypothetical protein